MTKKKLNVDSIANELEGASLFFKKSPTPSSLLEPVHEVPKTSSNSIPDSPTLPKVHTATQALKDEKRNQIRTDERSNERPNDVTFERPYKPKREKVRHTFDIYRDQLVSLQSIQLERFRAGKKKPKLGKMVAEGIDLYLKQYYKKSK